MLPFKYTVRLLQTAASEEVVEGLLIHIPFKIGSTEVRMYAAAISLRFFKISSQGQIRNSP